MALARKRKVYWILGIILAIIILIIASAPYILYKNQKTITASVITTLNETLVGHFTIEDSYIAPFANFPYISIDLKNVRFYDDDRMDKDPIYEIEDLYVGFNFWDLIKGNYNAKAIKASNARLTIITDIHNNVNIALAKQLTVISDSLAEEGEAFFLNLEAITFENLQFYKINESNHQVIDIFFENLNSNFLMQDELISAKLDSKLVLSIIEEDSSSLFKDKHIDVETFFQYDIDKYLISFAEDSKLYLEGAAFILDGTLDFVDIFEMDLRVRGDKPDFSTILAFAPNEIAEVLKTYENKGRIYFNGVIKGKAGANHDPFIEIEFGCENAYFLNPTENRKLDEIAFKGYYTNGEGHSKETTVFRLTDITARPEQGIFTGNIIIQNLNDPHISVNLYSDIQLEFLGAFLGIEGLRRLKGQILLKMDFQELVDLSIPENQLVRLKEGIQSELTIKNLSFLIPNHPHAVRDMNLYAAMRDGRLSVDSLSLKMGRSDLKLRGSISDLPAIFHKEQKPIKFKLSARSKYIILKELLAFDKALADSTNEEISDFRVDLSFETTVAHLLNPDPLPRGGFFIDDLYAKLNTYQHTFHDFHADILINDTVLRIKDFSGEIDQSNFQFTGQVKNYQKWFEPVKMGKSYFEFDLKSNVLRLNDLLTYDGINYLPEDYQKEEIRDLIVNGNLVLVYDSVFSEADLFIHEVQGKMRVHPLKLEKFSGKFHYEKDHFMIDRFSGKMGESDFNIDLHLYTGDDPTRKKRENKLVVKSNFLDFDQLSGYDSEEATNHEDSFNIFTVPFTDMSIVANINKMNYHKIWISDFRGRMRMRENHFLYIDTLGMNIAGGQLGIKGYFNGSNPEQIYFKSDILAQNIELDQIMFKFDNFGQDAMVSDNLVGRFTGVLTSNILMHPDLVPILEKGEATIDFTVSNGSLINFGPMKAMAAFFSDRNLSRVRFDTLRNVITLKDGVLTIPRMTINSSLGFMEISGRQNIDTTMDYLIRVPLGLVTQVGFRSLFGGKSREEIDPDREDAIETRKDDRRVRFLNMRVRGTPDNYDFSLGKGK